MADCSKTKVFLAEWKRMCDCTEESNCCAIGDLKSCEDMGEANCVTTVFADPQEAITLLQKWSDEHPQPKPKTYADVFFEHFPTASKDDACMPFICRKNIFGTGYGGCNYAGYDCRACWNEPYEENRKDEAK